MKILLDTHCWIWMTASPERFSHPVLEMLTDSGNRLFFSAVSAWELAIKFQLGKLRLPMPLEEWVPSRMKATGVESLQIAHVHGLLAGRLPPHHRDPFDRLLIAQARIERLPLLTADGKIRQYDIKVIEAT